MQLNAAAVPAVLAIVMAMAISMASGANLSALSDPAFFVNPRIITGVAAGDAGAAGAAARHKVPLRLDGSEAGAARHSGAQLLCASPPRLGEPLALAYARRAPYEFGGLLAQRTERTLADCGMATRDVYASAPATSTPLGRLLASQPRRRPLPPQLAQLARWRAMPARERWEAVREAHPPSVASSHSVGSVAFALTGAALRYEAPSATPDSEASVVLSLRFAETDGATGVPTHGGASLRMRLKGDTISLCQVVDHFDGRYETTCRLPADALLSGANTPSEALAAYQLSVRLDYAHFMAFADAEEEAMALSPAQSPLVERFGAAIEGPLAEYVLRSCALAGLDDALEDAAKQHVAALQVKRAPASCALPADKATRWTWTRLSPPADGEQNFDGFVARADGSAAGCDGGSAPRGVSHVAACLANSQLGASVTLVGASHMRYAFDALAFMAGAAGALAKAKRKHGAMSLAGFGLGYADARVGPRVASKAQRVLRAAADTDTASATSPQLVIAMSGAFEAAVCPVGRWVDVALPAYLHALAAAAAHAKAAGGEPAARLMVATPPAFPTYRMSMDGVRNMTVGRGHRNEYLLAAVAQLTEVTMADAGVAVLDYFGLTAARSELTADIAGHYIVPQRSAGEGGGAIEKVHGPVGLPLVETLLAAACASAA